MNDNKSGARLETERLVLRPLTVADAQMVYDNWASDPAVAKYMRWNTHTSAEATKAWLTQWEKSVAGGGIYDWGIVLKAINEPIGSIGALIDEDEPERYTFGYCIGRRFWGQGYMKEALRSVVQYMTDVAGVRHFYCYHAKENPASGAVMQSVGFRYVRDSTYKSYDGTREFESRAYYLDV